MTSTRSSTPWASASFFITISMAAESLPPELLSRMRSKWRRFGCQAPSFATMPVCAPRSTFASPIFWIGSYPRMSVRLLAPPFSQSAL
jgi:hypothetical protein